MLSNKYRQKIHSQVIKNISKKLHSEVYPVTRVSFIVGIKSAEPCISNVISSKIENIVLNSKLLPFEGSKDEISGYMQSESRRITQELYPEILYRFVSQLKKALPDLKRKFQVEFQPLKDVSYHMEGLRQCLLKGESGYASYFIGADVAVLPYFREDLAKSDFYQVSTNGDTVLAKQVAGVMVSLRDILSPYLDFQNKYVFYKQLVVAIEEQIEKPSFHKRDVYLAIWEAADRFRQEGQQSTEDYFEGCNQHLKMMEEFVSTNNFPETFH